MELNLTNPFLQEYLEYVEDTESPRIYHVWSAISSVGAALGRRVSFPFGIGPIYPNEYILLVGPPATRKSTAINIAGRLIKRATSIRIAPEDTAGKRQGLIAAMEDRSEEERTVEDIDMADIATFMQKVGETKVSLDTSDRHTLYAIASEFSIFLGQNSNEMINFLTKVYDGEDYGYRLKNQDLKLTEPLMSLIGGTTPTSIVETFPNETIGQGLMSRIILVYANKKYKRIARPKQLDPDLENNIRELLNYIYLNFRGEFTETDKAREMSIALYDKEIELEDPRFVYYCDRRQIHHIKLAMCLAAGRRSMTIEMQDIQEADTILKYTEEFMPEALGEFGLSPLAAAKQKLWEFIQHHHGAPILEHTLVSVMSRDMRRVDLLNTLAEMISQGRINRFDGDYGTMYAYNDREKEVLDLVAGDTNGRQGIHEQTRTVKFRFGSGNKKE